MEKIVGSDVTLQCVYTANPTVRITKWHFIELMNITSSIIFMGDTSGHYSVEAHSLTVYNLTAADGGLYTCNVTNQCGSDQISYHLVIIGNYYHTQIIFNIQLAPGINEEDYLLPTLPMFQLNALVVISDWSIQSKHWQKFLKLVTDSLLHLYANSCNL